jgi:hypothetical protein
MLDIFVPFAPPARTAADTTINTRFNLHVHAAPGPAFRPVATAQPAPPTAKAPTVTVEREGDLIKSIRIECACGQVHELACVY